MVERQHLSEFEVKMGGDKIADVYLLTEATL